MKARRKSSPLWRAGLSAWLLLCGTMPAMAEMVPRWELGMGVASLGFPDYRGASHTNVRTLPLPYVVYRGDTVQVKREGIAIELLDSDRLEIALSAGASLPGDDEAPSSPRAGMPELLPTFEAGPSLDYWLIKPGERDWQLRLRLPVRAVLASNFRQFEAAGWLVQPQVDVGRRWQPNGWSVRLRAGLGVLWASEAYHDYFYEVSPQFVTAQRSAFDAQAGYSGVRASLGLSAHRDRWRIGMGLATDRFGDADFADSPLVQTERSLVIGIGVAYRFLASRELTVREDD